MTVTIYFFSGTGNTHRAASIIGARLRDGGVDVELTDMASPRERDDSSVVPAGVPDLTILMFPVYAFAPPRLVRRFVRHRLPRANAVPQANGAPRSPASGTGRSRAAVVAVDGGNGFRAAAKARRDLRLRGYRVEYAERLGYPDDWRQFIPLPDTRQTTRVIEAGDERAASIADEIARGESALYRPGLVSTLLGNVVALLFASAGRRLLSQLFSADSSCTGCGVCARTCPVGAMQVVDRPRGAHRPVWSQRCESCNRCINVCPESAIVTSTLRFAKLVGMNVVFLVGAYLGLGAIGVSGVLLHSAAITGSIVATTISFTPVVRLMDRVPFVARIVERGFNKAWPQYLAPGYRPPKGPQP